MGWNPTGGNVSTVEKAEEFEILHDIAHRGRRQFFAEAAGQRTGTDGVAGIEIALDHTAKHLA